MSEMETMETYDEAQAKVYLNGCLAAADGDSGEALHVALMTAFANTNDNHEGVRQFVGWLLYQPQVMTLVEQAIESVSADPTIGALQLLVEDDSVRKH